MTTADVKVPLITLSDGTAIPQLGFGTLAVQPDRESSDANAERTGQIVSQAIAAGFRHLDTAQSYGTERGVGKGIRDSGVPRDQLYITSKLRNDNHAPDDVRRSFEQTLEHLGVDHLDLFLIHWPLPTLYDGDFVSTWRAVAELTGDGRLRTAGVSNFQPDHLGRIVAETGLVPAVNQFEVHPYFANSGAVVASADRGVAVEAHSPLGHNREPLSDATIAEIADVHRKSPAQVILRWHMQHGHIAIPKSARPERMAENIDIFDFELTEHEVASIDGLDRGAAGRVGPNPDTYYGVWPLPS